MRRALVALLLLATLLAGCSSNPKGPEDTDPDAFDDVQVTEETGAIRGVVVSEAIVPIPGVLITVANVVRNVTTDDQGAFVFNDLEPGAYLVSASKLGYKGVQVQAIVEAGQEPPVTKILLAVDVAFQPFAETIQWSGYLGCGGAAAGVGVNPCAADALLCDLGDVCLLNTANTHLFPFGATQVPAFAQAEMVWEGSQPLGNVLSLGWHRSGTSDFKGADGPSPLILPTNKTEIVEVHGENVTELLVRVFPGQQESGATVTLQQRFEVFVTYFYQFEPRAGWQFIVDGPCEPYTRCL